MQHLYHISDVLNKNGHKLSNPVSTFSKKDIILLPYLVFQSNQVAKRLKSRVDIFYYCVSQRSLFDASNLSFLTRTAFIVHNNPELFTEQITGIVMSFKSVKLNDVFMIGNRTL